jgi:hypothetical protein
VEADCCWLAVDKVALTRLDRGDMSALHLAAGRWYVATMEVNVEQGSFCLKRQCSAVHGEQIGS